MPHLSAHRKRSLVLLSGGLDSAANLAFCREYDDPVLAVTVRYGQKAQDREVSAASKISEVYQVEHRVLDLPWLGELGGKFPHFQSEPAVPKIATRDLDDPRSDEKSAIGLGTQPQRNFDQCGRGDRRKPKNRANSGGIQFGRSGDFPGQFGGIPETRDSCARILDVQSGSSLLLHYR